MEKIKCWESYRISKIVVIILNKIVIESLKNEIETADEEKKNVLLETIEDLEYQNETNEEIMKLLNSNAIEEFRNGK